MKVLVTGGAGYIGSVTTDHLLRAGHQVTVMDNLSKGFAAAAPKGVEFIQGDIEDIELVEKVCSTGIEAILHFAALIEAGESMREPEKYFENNTHKSERLIQTASKSGVKFFVFSSTAAVYRSKDEPLSETDTIEPANVYGQTKRMVEEKLEKVVTETSLRACVLRYFNAAGASILDPVPRRGEAHQPESHLIPNILKVALGQREKFTLFGTNYPTKDGTCVRDYIHVDDLARAHLLALKALVDQKFSFGIFNLGNGNGFTNLEVVEMARKITGHPIPIDFGPRREGDAAMLVANSTKAQEKLLWQPENGDLETIVRSAWEWHKNNPNGYEKVL